MISALTVIIWHIELPLIITRSLGKLFVFEDDFATELVGGRQGVGGGVNGLCQQHLPKDVFEGSGHVALLVDGAVILNGQDQWVTITQRRPTDHHQKTNLTTFTHDKMSDWD